MLIAEGSMLDNNIIMVVEYYIHSTNAVKDGKPEKCFSYVAFNT